MFQQFELLIQSSTKAVNFSSARTTKRFPSRCASAIQIVRPAAILSETLTERVIKRNGNDDANEEVKT
jgi:hypothetical protein